MKTELKKWIPISIVSIFLVSSFVTYAAGPSEDFVQRFQKSGLERGVKGGNHMQKGANSEMKEAIVQAFENNDYQAWVDVHNDRPNAGEFLTQENFEKMKKVHELMEAGQITEAQELRQEFRAKFQEQMRIDREARRAAVDKAIENGDYNEWLEAIGGRGEILEQVTVENFDEFVRAHELMDAGDIAEAREIMESLGIERSQGFRARQYAFGSGLNR